MIIVHCQTDAEAAQAQRLLPDRRIAADKDSKAAAPPDPAVAEQVDRQKLAAVVQEAFLPVTRASTRPIEEVMCNVETIDAPELRQAVEQAISQIAVATGLDTAQVTHIFKTNRYTDVNIVNQLHKESRVNW